MSIPGPQFRQAVLPGMGRIKRAAPKAVPAVTSHEPVNSGPVPGQTVMGVSELARGRVQTSYTRQPSSRFPGGIRRVPNGQVEEHYHVDPHGYVQEGYQEPPHHDRAGGGIPYVDHAGQDAFHERAADLYGTHGGRFAKTTKEAAAEEGGTPSDYGVTTGSMQMHDAQVKAVKAHWNSQPLVQFPTSTLVHSSQSHEETEGDATEQRETQRPARGWRAATGSPSGLGQRFATLHTAGGSPQMRTSFTDVPGSGDGRKRIEAIKQDLAE